MSFVRGMLTFPSAVERCLSAIFFGMCVVTAFAVPAKRDRCWLKLADGTAIEATRMGDETIHFYLTDDGQYLQCDSLDIAHFVEPDAIHKRWKSRLEKRQNVRTRRNAVKRQKSYPSSISGSKRGLVILVQFPSLPFQFSNSTFQDYFNKEGYTDDLNRGSVHDYFYDSSYGQFDFSFDVVGPITMSQSLAYYGANNKNGDDQHPAVMVTEAVHMLDDEVDFSQYDWDGDGVVEQIYIIHSGFDEAQSGTRNDIWSHAWTLTEAKDENDGNGPVLVDGVIIDSYATSSELRDNNGTKISGIGTACHEFSHCFGLPDTYDTAGHNFGMRSWDLMDYGEYNGDGGTPAGFTSYERMFCGWLEPIELNEATIVRDMPALTSEPVAYILRNSGKYDEYYLLENRQQESWDSHLAGHGMLILHVDYDSLAWMENTLNTVRSHQRMTIIPADNLLYTYTLAGDPWPGTTGNTELSNTSIPAATLYNMNADGSTYMDHSFTEISESADGLISFIFDEEVLGIGDAERINDKGQMINDNAVYDLAGRRIDNSKFKIQNSSQSSGAGGAKLQKGIYIQSGKKYLITTTQ